MLSVEAGGGELLTAIELLMRGGVAPADVDVDGWSSDSLGVLLLVSMLAFSVTVIAFGL